MQSLDGPIKIRWVPILLYRLLLLCLGFSLFTGCASHNTKPNTADLLPTPVEGKAVLVIYRKAAKPNNLPVENFIGEQSLGALRNNQFSWIYLEPGDYTVKTQWPDAALIPTTERHLNIESGRYYLLEMRGGVGIAVLFQSRELKPTSTSLKTGDYSQAIKWLDHCCQLVK
jgi:Protein of unknown function (DUF2846).